MSQTKPSIVFAHGLWADGSCFSKLIPTLLAEGHEVVSVQNSLDTLEGDVAAVIRALGRVSSPAILVGHSQGGTIISGAGADDRVTGLVYIAALAPDFGETAQSLQEQFPTTEIFSHIEITDGRIWMLPDGIKYFAGDLPEQEQKLVWATQGVPDANLFSAKTETPPGGRSPAGTSWPTRTTPSTRSWNTSLRSAWAPPPTRPTAATLPCSPSPASSSTSSAPPHEGYEQAPRCDPPLVGRASPRKKRTSHAVACSSPRQRQPGKQA